MKTSLLRRIIGTLALSGLAAPLQVSQKAIAAAIARSVSVVIGEIEPTRHASASSRKLGRSHHAMIAPIRLSTCHPVAPRKVAT